MEDIQLIHGDCLEEMKKIPDGSVDLILQDPRTILQLVDGSGIL